MRLLLDHHNREHGRIATDAGSRERVRLTSINDPHLRTPGGLNSIAA
jgi:hypothetical protein